MLRPLVMLSLAAPLIALAQNPSPPASQPAPRSAPQPTPQPAPQPAPPPAYLELPKVGEELTYEVNYTGVVGAYIKVKVGEGPAEQPQSRVITAYLATTPLVQQIWQIRDKIMALYAPHQGRTLATRLWEEENGKRLFREERFDGSKVKVVERRSGGDKSFDVDAEAPLLDAFSALFDLRRRPLVPGSTERARVYLNRRVYDVDAKVTREVIEHNGQKVSTLRVDPELSYKGKKLRKVGFVFWLSEDAARVPLRIEADVRYGKLAGTLVPGDKAS